MNKIVLVDGNNLMFRSYFATAYTGNLMKNSKGQVTNALYGFANMINKILKEEEPSYMAVAFDIGKTFRHEVYKDYKAGRQKTPEELKSQMPIAKEMLTAMGIKYLELDGYEADDIIGTLSERANQDPEWDALLVTSDHDYLQLITDVTTVKMLRPKDYIKYTPEVFKEEYGIEPIKVIDLKALMGDSSDNIPGVPGVGEKTALKLLQEYGTLDNLYENVESVKGKLKDKLIENKESAYFSYKLATIIKDAPIDVKFEDLKYDGPTDKLDDFYYNLEFFSLVKNHKKEEKTEIKNEYKELVNVNEISLDKNISYYIEVDNENYHVANILGMGLYDGTNTFYIDKEKVLNVLDYIKDNKSYTFDYKKNIVISKNTRLNTIYDLNLVAYLLNKNIKDDLAILMNQDEIVTPLYKDIIKDNMDIKPIVTLKAKYIHETHDKYINDLKLEDEFELYENIEHPLIKVLAKMEIDGIRCDADILKQESIELEGSISKIEKEIYELAGEEFNISSPKQLGEILFEKMSLPHAKKTKTGYSTSEEVLEKLINDHPIISKILEYRKYTKLNSTYLQGLNKFIMEDGKIHTIYNQTLTRTGRLSSQDPNLQNIPARDELGRLVKKAFLPSNDEFLSCDYSQIELRVLAHISKCKPLIDSFLRDEDIHTRVAADIYNIPFEDVTKNQRRTAKSVIFGIVYGISGFGLGENIGISPKEAKAFIDKYYELYPGVKEYMNLTVEDAKNTGYTETLYKRRRYIDELFSSNFMVRQSGERMAMNTPIQGTAADILKMAMIEIDKRFVENNIKSKMLLQIHDELVFDIIKDEEQKVIDIVTDAMQNIVKLEVPLKVSSDLGSDLYETK
jgi:DNA polymerase-1